MTSIRAAESSSWYSQSAYQHFKNNFWAGRASVIYSGATRPPSDDMRRQNVLDFS